MTQSVECGICARRQNEQPLGGYVYEDEHWYAHHAPPGRAVLGELMLISQRHFMDAADMQAGEAASYGQVLGKLTAAIKKVVAAERVYTVAVVEATPHLHVWLIPRGSDATERGTAFLTNVLTGGKSISEEDAASIAGELRAELAQ